MADELEIRLAKVEARLHRLEGLLADAPPTEGTFWALEGLKARTEGPGGVLIAGAVTLEDERRAEWQESFALDGLLDGFDEDAATALTALAHPIRLLIVREVLRGPVTAAELGERGGLGTSGQTYHHLRQLVAAGWLRTAGRGRYTVPVERVVPLLVAVAAVRR